MNDYRKIRRPGTTVTLNQIDYQIEDVLKITEQLFIYLASNANHSFILKEYYPLSSKFALERTNGAIISSDPVAFDDAKQKYLKYVSDIYETILPLDISSWIVTYRAPEIFDSQTYNTIYIIENYDNALSYAQTAETDILELIENLLSLVRLTSAIHDRGYLIFNLEPRNIIIRKYRNHAYLSLLDYDCLSKDYHYDISQLNDKYLSLEVLNNLVGDFSETIDNFAIGTILAERLKGLSQTNFHWRLKDLLQEIIDHTVAPSNRRFSDEKLLVGLLKCLDFAKIKHTLIPMNLTSPNYLGLQSQIEAIELALINNKYALISGKDGIGKRSLAYQYAYAHRNDFVNIQIVDYELSWPKTLRHLRFANPKSAQAPIDELMLDLTLQFDQTLLIINNYPGFKEDPWLECLLKHNLKIILTTSTNSENAIKPKSLTLEQAKALFIANYGKPISENEMKDLHFILKQVDFCPDLIKLIAKTLKYHHQTIMHGPNISYYASELLKYGGNGNHVLVNGAIIFKLKRFNPKVYQLIKLLYFFNEIALTSTQLKELGFKEQLLITLVYENILIIHNDFITLNRVIFTYLKDLERKQRLTFNPDLYYSLNTLNDPDISLAVLTKIDEDTNIFKKFYHEDLFKRGDIALVKRFLNIHHNDVAETIYQKRLMNQKILVNFLNQNANQYQSIFKMRSEIELKQLKNKYELALNSHKYEQAIDVLLALNYEFIFKFYNDEMLAKNLYAIANVYFDLAEYQIALRYLNLAIKLIEHNPNIKVDFNYRALAQALTDKLL